MLIGPDIVFKFLFRSLTIDDVIQRVADKLRLRGRAILCPYPEIGMDVDKPHQLEIMRSFLGAKARRSPARKAAVVQKKPASSRRTAARKTSKTVQTRPAGKAGRKATARPSRRPRSR
jgi:hypothetical protein